MVSNTIKLGLGSILLLLVFACQNAIKPNNNVKQQPIDTCRYYAYDAQHVVSNLGCYNCHVRTDERLFEIPTFGELANMDSLKLVNYAFTKKHTGWYSKNGTFKASKMDTLSECEIKSAIRYIKDYNREIPMPGQ